MDSGQAASAELQPRRAETSGPQTYGFLLIPNFSLLAFSSALEPLRAANRLVDRPYYEWHLISPQGGMATASSGIEVKTTKTTAEVERLNTLIVVGGLKAERFADKSTFAWLRRLDREGVRVGALSTGTYLLAKAGMLEGYRCTIHWEYLEAFAEEYPNLEVSPELYEIDRNRFTCSGGTAVLDLMLSLIALEHGRDLATQVAEQFIHERIREQHDSHRMALRSRLGVSHPKLLKVVELMEAHQEEPLSRADLAQRAGLSTRQLERLFRKYLHRTPTRYYLELRLNRARKLLNQTAMPVLDVALACGFISASHFSKCYREFFNRTPREERALQTP